MKLVILFTLVCATRATEKWADYYPRAPNQGDKGICWAFSTSSFLEIMYGSLTNNRLSLSPQQLTDELFDFAANDAECHALVSRSLSFAPGISRCVLKYVERFGVMSEYNYPVAGGLYNQSRATPLGVADIQQICPNCNPIAALNSLRSALEVSVVIAEIAGMTNAKEREIDTQVWPDHTIVIVGLIQEDGDLYVKYLNSLGPFWGENGFGYIRVSNSSGAINNRQIFTSMWIARVFDKYGIENPTRQDNLIATCISNGQATIILSAIELAIQAVFSLFLLAAILYFTFREKQNGSLRVPLVNQ